MKHLSIEEIIDYVMVSKVNAETLDLLSRVNGHIRNCTECKEKVLAFETINDELRKRARENRLDLNQIEDLIKIESTNELRGGI